MKLSQHFTLAEATKSQTASRLSIDNTPDAETVERMRLVCENILEPVRTQFNLPVTVNSFYRSPRLNAEVGSKPNSQHVKGEAVDFEVPGIPNAEVAEWVRDNLTADQIILEFYTPGDPSSGWVHVSYVPTNPRQQCLTINAGGTLQGLVA
jgi:zinc D-Ala-D-Ala carboxypeptidase